MSVFIHVIVGEFDFVETDSLLHPVSSRRRGIRVDVISTGNRGVALSRHCPPGAESIGQLGMTVWGMAPCVTDYVVTINGTGPSSSSSDLSDG